MAVLVALASLAPDTTASASDAGEYSVIRGTLIHAGRGMAFGNQGAAAGTAASYTYFSDRGPLTATRIRDGRRIWRAKGITRPMHVHGDRLVSLATDPSELVIAILDVSSGAVKRRIRTGLPAPHPQTGNCARGFVGQVWGHGAGRKFTLVHERTVCAAQPRRGQIKPPVKTRNRPMPSPCKRTTLTAQVDLRTFRLKKGVERPDPKTLPRDCNTGPCQVGKTVVEAKALGKRDRLNPHAPVRVVVRHRNPGENKIRRELLLGQGQYYSSPRLSSYGRHVFVTVRASASTKPTRIYDSISGKELPGSPIDLGGQYWPRRFIDGVVTGHENGEVAGFRLRDGAQVWRHSALPIPEQTCHPMSNPSRPRPPPTPAPVQPR